VWWPLKRLDVADRADGAVVLVLAEERVARELTGAPVWVAGVGWSSGSPTLESRAWGEVDYVRDAGDRAYEMAGVATPSREIDIAEVDDLYSYRELMSLEALRLAPPDQAARLLGEGHFGRDGEIPVNVSGGSLGQGNLFEANGLAKAMECVLQLRGEAGERQMADVRVAVAQSWRGIPTTSAAVAVLAADEAVA
jgi:acetyl-CoA C-acetyltransferase